MDRRTFLELVGVGGASTLAACNGAPRERIYSYLNPPAGMVPGVPTYYATICRQCSAGCGVIVKTREARPIKLEGNPAHPVNQGKLCSRGQAAIQGLYGRHRVQRPQLRVDGKLVNVAWETALAAAAEMLKGAKKVGLLTGLESGTFEDLVKELGERLPGFAHVRHEPISLAGQKEASKLLFGLDDVPELELDQADHVVSFGADFLDAWISPVKFSRQWSDAHGGIGRKQFVEYIGPRRNLTATSSDRFTRVPPDAVDGLARALLRAYYEIKKVDLSLEASALMGEIVAKIAPAGGPDVSAFIPGLRKAQSPVFLFGGTEVSGAGATATHIAVLLMNLLGGAFGKSLQYGRGSAQAKVDADGKVHDFVNRAGELDALLVYGSNPAYTLPGGIDPAKKLAQAKHLIVFATEYNETTALAEIVFPTHHPLESWGDFEVNADTVGLSQPVRTPLFDSRHVGDILIDVCKRAGHALPHKDYRACVTERFAQKHVPDLTDALIKGGLFQAATTAKVSPALSGERNQPLLAALAKSVPTTLAGQGAILIPAVSSQLYDGRETSKDWLMEAPDSLTQSAWEIPAELAKDVAAQAGVKTGDRVRLKGAAAEFLATAYVDDDLAAGTVALRMGGGRAQTRDLPDSGNVFSLLGSATDPLSGALAYVQSRVQVSKAAPGEMASVSGGSDSESEHRDLCLRVELADAREGRFPVMTRHGDHQPIAHGPAGGHGDEAHGKGHKSLPILGKLPTIDDDLAHEGKRPHDNAYELAKHPEHRWGLSVDLDKCTGCGACVVACFSENNIPMVGRKLVMQGREMQWIRIEKHVFEKEAKDRRVRFLPVMCQQCAQAPCETVCPVFASYHTPDGLNGQVYNRCIGTRYCSNNCPYKARRFNYFDYEREQPATQQLNPDVSVRSRGIMEKCTFCIQRIRETTNQAKAENRPVKDGEIQTACQQTCPTKALTFGDYKQKESAVAKLSRDPRGYRLLDYQVNTRPSVVYLRKVYSDGEKG